MRISIALVAAALLAGPVVADTSMPSTPPGSPDPRLAKSGSYTLDSAHTQVLFTVNHLGFSEYTGMFTNPTGSMMLDTRVPANSRVQVSFPTAQVRTTAPQLDTELGDAGFFNSTKYPTATFVSTRVAMTGPTTGTIAGTLTIKGVAKPVVLKARFIGAGTEFWGNQKPAIGFAATATIKRTDFGIGDPSPLVSDEVRLVINAGFEAVERN